MFPDPNQVPSPVADLQNLAPVDSTAPLTGDDFKGMKEDSEDCLHQQESQQRREELIRRLDRQDEG